MNSEIQGLGFFVTESQSEDFIFGRSSKKDWIKLQKEELDRFYEEWCLLGYYAVWLL
jgi:hypothetical protein